MELNITKHTLNANELAFSQNVEQGVDFEVNMPDYCRGIQRILRSCVSPRISSKTISGQSLIVEGTVCFSVIYLDEDNNISSYEHSVPFSKTVDHGSNLDNGTLSVRAKCSYMNTKAVTLRKLQVHSIVELQIKILCRRMTDIISDIDCPEIFVNRGEAPATTPISSAEKNIIIEEELEIGSTQPHIGSIIRYDVFPSVTNHKIINDKVIVKGELYVDVMYCSDDHSSTEKFGATVPFSQIVDIDGITEECECDINLDVAFLELKPRSTYDGENRSFMLNAKVCIGVRAVCNNDVAVIYDAYSPKYNLSVQNTDVAFEKIIDSVSENYICKKKIEFSDGDIANIIDLWCSCVLQGYRIDDNCLIINGTVNVSMLSENEDKITNYFERPIDFEYRYSAQNLPEEVRCEPSVSVVGLSYTITGDNTVEVRVELSINASVCEIKRINIITSVEALSDQQQKPIGDCSMMIYYAEKGERIWDIAKRFNASPDEIMEINSVGETLDENKTILISC